MLRLRQKKINLSSFLSLNIFRIIVSFLLSYISRFLNIEVLNLFSLIVYYRRIREDLFKTILP